MQLANRRAALFALTLAAIASAAGASRTGVDGERSRLRQAERAPIEVQRCERAPSRSAALDRPQREVIYDAAGRPISIVDAMGTIVTREFDALARPELVRSGGSPAAAYGYQGPDLVAQKELGNGLSGQMSYDAARRRVETAYQQPGAATPVMGESVSRSPRGQIVSVSRTDEGGSGFVARYDGAGRLTEQGRDPASFPGNNTLPDPLTVAGLPDSSAFRFDAADNLVSKAEEKDLVLDLIDLPLDDSHRNRPASIGGTVPVEWDANGNLARKGDLTFRYDYRNRLTEVATALGPIASYRYDAFNRRIERTLGTEREETVWSGWQSLETYRDGTLSSRRTYGLGLDEIVKLEQDRDGDGALDEAQVPLYDTSGNLVALTRGTDGTPVEKYAYSPFGEQRIFVDLTRPRIEQLRREGDALLLEVSERVQLAALAQARANGDLTLTDTSTGQPIEVEVSLPVLTGRTARKRIRIQPTTTIAESTPVRLHLAPKAVLDFFQNPLEAAYDRDLVWSATGSALIEDTAAPQLDLVRVHENVLTVAFTEAIDVAQVTAAITVDGNPVTWTADEDGYGLRTDPPLANGQHRIEIAASLEDLAGTPLTTGFARTVEITPAGALVYVRPDPREISSTAASNPYGFQGLPRDPETGFVYARNRYYDPEIGRFISTDPLGYIDGGNLYQYGLNDPINNADPLGLESWREATERLAVDAYASDDPLQWAAAFGAQLLHATASALSAGAVSKIDANQEALDRGQINRHTYWKKTGVAALQTAATYAGGAGAGAVGARAGVKLLAARGVTSAGVRAAGALSGATGGVGGTLASDVVGIAAGEQSGLSSGETYLTSAAVGGVVGVSKAIPSRAGRDSRVDPTAPSTKPTSCPVGRSSHNQAVQTDIQAAQSAGAREVRVNQQQVNSAGERVGVNRPDLQYTTSSGRRAYVEYDAPPATRSVNHALRLLANDPSGIVYLRVIP